MQRRPPHGGAAAPRRAEHDRDPVGGCRSAEEPALPYVATKGAQKSCDLFALDPFRDDVARVSASRKVQIVLVSGTGSLGGDETGKLFQGSVVQVWTAPNITGDKRRGVDSWSFDEVVYHLRTGHNRQAAASGRWPKK